MMRDKSQAPLFYKFNLNSQDIAKIVYLLNIYQHVCPIRLRQILVTNIKSVNSILTFARYAKEMKKRQDCRNPVLR